jgi:uncharacterized membrane protein YfcA
VTWTAAAVIVGAVLLGAFAKGITGSGLPLVAVPVIAGFFGVQRAVLVMVVPTLVTNAVLLWEHRASLRGTRDLPVLLLAGVLGVAVGTYGLTVVDDDVLSLVLAGVIVLYLALFKARPDLTLPPSVSRLSAPGVGLVSGVLQGATGVSGPIVVPFLHAYRLSRGAFVLSQTAVFQAFALMQVVTLTAVGLFTPQRIVEGLLALVPALLAMPIGMRVARHVPRRTFDLLVLGLLALTAVKLVYDGVT